MTSMVAWSRAKPSYEWFMFRYLDEVARTLIPNITPHGPLVTGSFKVTE